MYRYDADASTRDGSCTVRTRVPVRVGTTESRVDGDSHVVTFNTTAGSRVTLKALL